MHAMRRFAPGERSSVKVSRTDTLGESHLVANYGHGYQVHTFITWALGN